MAEPGETFPRQEGPHKSAMFREAPGTWHLGLAQAESVPRTETGSRRGGGQVVQGALLGRLVSSAHCLPSYLS